MLPVVHSSTRRYDRGTLLAHARNRNLTATGTVLNTVGTYNRPISPETVKCVRVVFMPAVRTFGPPLTQACRLRRIAWLTAHAPRRIPMKQWRRVVFYRTSFASLFFSPENRHRVYRRRGKCFADACDDKRDRFGDGSVMDWGGIAHGIKAQWTVVEGNMTAVRYRDEILHPVAVLLVQQRQMILQQENTRLL